MKQRVGISFRCSIGRSVRHLSGLSPSRCLGVQGVQVNLWETEQTGWKEREGGGGTDSSSRFMLRNRVKCRQLYASRLVKTLHAEAWNEEAGLLRQSFARVRYTRQDSEYASNAFIQCHKP